MVKAIVGANWGDEGKGKITDMLAEESDIIVRFQGGANAGHTIINDYGKFALHLLPSGVFYNHTTSVIGNGVALNIPYLVKELKSLITFNVLKNATINEADRTITLAQQQPQQQTVTQFVNDVAAGFTGASEQAAPVSCTCPGCGAKVVVRPGQTVVCEYCDTPITAN